MLPLSPPEDLIKRGIIYGLLLRCLLIYSRSCCMLAFLISNFGLVVMVTCLTSFRALFTSNKISQRLPDCYEVQRADLE